MADGSTPAGYLGVTKSLSGRLWRERAADPETVRRHEMALGLPEPLARALASRGVQDGLGEHYLNPTLKALFPDPSSFMDMDKAATILVDAVAKGRPMAVFADYDVDGASSAAQLVRWTRAMGAPLRIYVPDRITEGYGPSPAAFRRLKDEGVELVITVDCGAAAMEAVTYAVEIGLEVVVIDHHLMRGDEVPPATALVNPNRPGCGSGQGVLAAAGVTFVLMAALNREARRQGLFTPERPEPDIRQWLDLACMGAICDVTQLVGFNRALASQGLKVMSGWRNPGLKALLDVAKSQGPATAFHVGFVLGPRINAGGRIGRADLGARLLATDDPREAADLAAELDALNASRKEVEREVLEQAVQIIERESNQADLPVLLVSADDWHPGVIGIVAGRLRERYRKPVMVIGVDRAANVGKGSGRSQPGVNLGRAVQAAYEEGLLIAGGGHAMAAGLSVKPDTIPELRAFLCERLADESEVAAAEDGLDIDALITTGGADRALYESFQRMAPFGPGNPEPVFALSDVRVERAMALKGGHVRVTLTDRTGGKLKAVAWRSEGTEIGARLLAEGGGLHIVGRLKPDDWQGRSSVELEIEDVADLRRVG
ncbi:MAG: single-stranded-DNA-specific exonuclease RecJ [Phenylobacterium sp.]|uniref:single-stranded-DNA-specific exonuclease RecJ n=1 Tax=Phenylobacterium sp. TaxID=1871053 RepID=UPI00271BB18C|nr:single-stranded-DNA-specific exonuclease RecJ [Phenylobacterium sp.]MDO8912351.1 single-stranded-DNA-specific exonuclease RecJ [Phenylobacterium sp.]MDP3099563.1 single-stranded-DNA-specific exonuclease RecJ [Phenylobacterium sp.]MDP3867128.1 single-stranded-DNA-specific exonuclease RecJ [Phenylobacterium sp.]